MNKLDISAIQAAFNSSWKEAIKINKKILKTTPKYTGALNRLAFAYQATGEIKKADQLYKKVLKIDPCNLIAFKSIKKIKDFNLVRGFTRNRATVFKKNLFLEEPGITKITNLNNLTSKSKLSELHCGDQLILYPRKHDIVFHDLDGMYIGALPDDLSYFLLDFIKKGNKYEAYIKGVSKNVVTVFIKETFRVKKLQAIPSFPLKDNRLKFSQPEEEEAEKKNSQSLTSPEESEG